MRTEHRGPLAAFVVLAVACGMFLTYTLQTQSLVPSIGDSAQSGSSPSQDGRIDGAIEPPVPVGQRSDGPSDPGSGGGKTSSPAPEDSRSGGLITGAPNGTTDNGDTSTPGQGLTSPRITGPDAADAGGDPGGQGTPGQSDEQLSGGPQAPSVGAPVEVDRAPTADEPAPPEARLLQRAAAPVGVELSEAVGEQEAEQVPGPGGEPPTEENPTEETPAEETPAEESPTDEPTTDETPGEETPGQEPSTSDSPTGTPSETGSDTPSGTTQPDASSTPGAAPSGAWRAEARALATRSPQVDRNGHKAKKHGKAKHGKGHKHHKAKHHKRSLKAHK